MKLAFALRLTLVQLVFGATLAFGQQNATEPELLEAEQAFRFSARLLDAATVEVSYHIADGYYMYRDKFRFRAESGGKVGTAQFPAATMHVDPLFGNVATYRKTVLIRLPVADLGPDRKLALTVIAQGCADAGVCYPPMTSRLVLGLEGTKASGSLSSILKP